MLTDEQCAVVERIARTCSRRHRAEAPLLTLDDRYDAALDGIIEHVHEDGWPGTEKPLYAAGSLAITRAHRESWRHLRRWSYWYEPPGAADALGEAITDRIAVWEIAWMLSEEQWRAVWAMGEAIRRGEGKRTAASLAGMSHTVFTEHLHRARRRCLAVWCAPGEHVQPYYASRGNKVSKIHAAIDKRRERDRRAAA
jgi:hypothetical protein